MTPSAGMTIRGHADRILRFDRCHSPALVSVMVAE